MRKILLASTALVAVAGVSAANAEVSFSGNSAFSYTTFSDDVTDADGENNNEYGTDTDLGLSWSTTTATGMSVSVAIDLDDSMTANSAISGDWGKIAFNDQGDADGDMAAGDADPVEDVTLGSELGADDVVLFDGGESISGGHISYSNTFSGISFAIGSKNAGNASEANETSYSVSYSASANGADFTIGYAAASTGAPLAAAASLDKNASSLNAEVTVGDLTVSMANNTLSNDRNDDNQSAAGYLDAKSTNLGVSYAISDALTLTAQTKNVSGDSGAASNVLYNDYKFEEKSYGLAYSVATGVDLFASFTDYSQSGIAAASNISGTGTTVKIAVSF